MTDWRELWEQHAEAEHRKLAGLPVPELLERIRSGKPDGYYQIWPVAAARATLGEAGWPLFEAMLSYGDSLHRHHAAEALLTLMRETRWTVLDLVRAHPDRERYIDEVRSALERRIGPPP